MPYEKPFRILKIDKFVAQNYVDDVRAKNFSF